MEQAYTIIYNKSVEELIQKLKIIGVEKYIVLNDKLVSVYVEDGFDDSNFYNIENISWWEKSEPMSSLINITDNIEKGEKIYIAAGTEYVEQNQYISISGKDTIIAILDSGIDYSHPDFINTDRTSKIISIWDQNSSKKEAPQGLLFGSEFTNKEINEAIKIGDKSLTVDNKGTGTIAAGISVGNGNLNYSNRGIAKDSELIIVKLREYIGTYKEDVINYELADFLAGIKYILDKVKDSNKKLIINITVGEQAKSSVLMTLLESFTELNKNGVVVVSGAGNEGNTDTHYKGECFKVGVNQDISIQVGEQKNLDIALTTNGPDKIGVQVIAPSREISSTIMYAPDNYIYKGIFNIEGTTYEMKYMYPWLKSGNLKVSIKLKDIKPGVWILRIVPEFLIDGSYDVYLPNKALISKETRFFDPSSKGTITFIGTVQNTITVGTFNNRTDSMWVGSSKGSSKCSEIKPDIVAPGVDIIGAYIGSTYNTGIGSGISSSIVSGVIALLIEYIDSQKTDDIYFDKLLFSEVLKTYLMMGATKKTIYKYPNLSQGYGILNLKDTIIQISRIL